MLSLYLQDPTKTFWLVTMDTVGDPQVIKQPGVTIAHYKAPVLLDPKTLATYQITVDSVGDIILTPATSAQVLKYLIFSDTFGHAYQLGVVYGSPLIIPVTSYEPSIPYPNDVSMSHWPDGVNGLICPNCNNATVTASADLSLWCGSCSTFVPPEDTIIEVALSE